jgi:hypothetical protein
MPPLVTMVAIAALATFGLGASLVEAKSPPSAYGSSFNDGETMSGGSPNAADDIDEEEITPRKPKDEPPPSYRRPRSGQRVKARLDGGVGESELEALDDD